MYYTVSVKINEDSIKEALQDIAGYDEEEIESMNLENEAVELIDGFLSNYISDYTVYNKNSILFNWDDDDE